MGLVKDDVVRLVQALPDDCTLEDIQYHLYVRQKVERGLEALDRGPTIPQEEAERRLAAWLSSNGPSPR